MAVRRIDEMTWEEVRGLDGDRTLAILPVGATEAHGPHLPLSTDVVISEAMARAGGARLAAAGFEVLLLPALAYSPAAFASGFAGTISLGEDTATAVLVEVAAGLAAHGIRRTIVANSHFDPANIRSIYAAVERCRADGAAELIYPDLTRRPWAARLTDEFKSGACHAGRFEGSIVLAERPDLVREEIRAALPPNPQSLSVAIRDGKQSFEEAGGDRAYFGEPAAATAAEGARTIAELGEILAEAALAHLERG
ncbi:MAG: creatininase family protein [Planctomycetota bacterium]